MIIPCYNESTTIGEVVSGVISALKNTQFEFEVAVVDDCSPDNSAALAKAAGARVIRHILNRGAGGATSTGLRFAKSGGFDFALTMDADGQHSPQDAVACLINAANIQTDLLIGSRLMNTEGMSAVKVLGNKGLSLITWGLFGVNVTDSQSGLRVFSKAALSSLEWKSTGYEFCSEMIWRAKQAHLSIKEFPIQAIYTEYSKSKGQNNWNAVNIVRALVGRRFVEVFE